MLALVAGAFAVAPLNPLLPPNPPLDGRFANIMLVVTETGNNYALALICSIMLLIVVGRPGVPSSRRVFELCSLGLALLLAVGAGGLANEAVLKPHFSVPRPNIVALSTTPPTIPVFENIRRRVLRSSQPFATTQLSRARVEDLAPARRTDEPADTTSLGEDSWLLVSVGACVRRVRYRHILLPLWCSFLGRLAARFVLLGLTVGRARCLLAHRATRPHAHRRSGGCGARGWRRHACIRCLARVCALSRALPGLMTQLVLAAWSRPPVDVTLYI